MSSEELSPEILAELAALDAMPDEAIDTSDARVLTDEEWADPRRRRYRGAQNRPVSVSIEGQLAGWFRARAGDQPVESEIERALHEYKATHEKLAG